MNRSRRTRDRRLGPRRPPRDELLRHSDEQLVELVLDGHDPAFDVLFDRHVADSLWYAREVLGSWGEAEEAVRHSFAAAHAYLATRGHETEFSPWLQTILGNYCLSMLQARTPGPGGSVGDSAVVDLGEWRLRRKLMGIALPIPAGAGLRESGLAACGIGGGAAATAGAPLLGGTLAKLAVVAVLAGGVGVAGDVSSSSDRGAAADVGSQPRAMTEAGGGGAAVGADHGREPWGGARHPTDAKLRKRAVVTPPPLDERAPSERAPDGSTPPDAGPAGPTESPRDQVAPVELQARSVTDTPSRSALGEVGNVAGAAAPAIKSLAESPPLGSMGLSKVVDGLGAVVSTPASDVRTLLPGPAPE